MIDHDLIANQASVIQGIEDDDEDRFLREIGVDPGAVDEYAGAVATKLCHKINRQSYVDVSDLYHSFTTIFRSAFELGVRCEKLEGVRRGVDQDGMNK